MPGCKAAFNSRLSLSRKAASKSGCFGVRSRIFQRYASLACGSSGAADADSGSARSKAIANRYMNAFPGEADKMIVPQREG